MRIIDGHRIVDEPSFLLLRTQVGYFHDKATADSAALLAPRIAADWRIAIKSNLCRLLPCLWKSPGELPLLKRWHNRVLRSVGDNKEVLAVGEDAVIFCHNSGTFGLLCDEVTVEGVVGDDLAGCERGQEVHAPGSLRRRSAFHARQ